MIFSDGRLTSSPTLHGVHGMSSISLETALRGISSNGLSQKSIRITHEEEAFCSRISPDHRRKGKKRETQQGV
jgi:hypothetical protein